MVSPQMLDFIQAQQKLNRTLEDIKKDLSGAGWLQSDIDEGIRQSSISAATVLDNTSDSKPKIINIISILFLSVLLLALYAFNAYIGFYVLGMGNNVAVSYGMSWVVMTISAFGVMIPTPGGTGSYHLISIFALTKLFAFNYETSAAYAIFTHLISYVLSILSAVMMIYLVNWQRGRKGLKRENIFSVFSIKSGDK